LVDSQPKSNKKYALAALGAYYSLVLLPQQKKSQHIRAALKKWFNRRASFIFR